jgi:hypothetical protein
MIAHLQITHNTTACDQEEYQQFSNNGAFAHVSLEALTK